MFETITEHLTNTLTDDALRGIMTKQYGENLFNMVTIFQKLGPAAVVEACMRAETGMPIERPLGSPNVQSPWEKLFLNPTQLFSLPTEDGKQIKTEVVIGRNSKRPLRLGMPVMITAMSYGASLSLESKIALAKAASMAGTCTNTGESSVADEEREAANLLIGQYNRYEVLKCPDQLRKLDAIEVQLGQGAWGGALPATIKADKIRDHMKASWNLKDGEDAVRKTRFENVNTPEDIINLLNSLKQQYDVPVGVKIAASHYIEDELDVILQTNIDFVVIDGSEGGTAAAFATLEDCVGLPTLVALGRAAKHLESKGAKDKYDLIIAGGLKTPGDFAKAIALGAKAVYIGTIALIAMLQNQLAKSMPQYPAPQLVMYNGKLIESLDIDNGAQNLSNFLKSCNEELKLVLIALGKDDISQLSRKDIVSMDKELAAILGVSYAGIRG